LDNELTEPVKPFSIKEHIASMKAEEARKREEYLKAENQEKAAHNELTELHEPVPQYLTLKEKLQAQGTIK
jgi:beta-phosphoglucomutase-like phosphatase (HAD superfamily)